MCDVMPRVRSDDDQVRSFASSRIADRGAGIGSLFHNQPRRHIRVRAPNALAQRLELLLFRVFVCRVVQRKAQLIGMRVLRDANVQDDQLSAGRRRKLNGVVERPLGSGGEVGRDENATPGIHETVAGCRLSVVGREGTTSNRQLTTYFAATFCPPAAAGVMM